VSAPFNPLGLSMELFKYTRREFELATLERGSIRLGTLFDYRKAEDHGAQVGDAREGKVTLGGTIERGQGSVLTFQHFWTSPGLERTTGPEMNENGVRCCRLPFPCQSHPEAERMAKGKI
jgi:hypothetical protein